MKLLSLGLIALPLDEDADPAPAHGYSKHHRPDLKQLIYGFTLHGAVGIPLDGRREAAGGAQGRALSG